MKNYLINLDKNTDRLEHMTKLLKEKGIAFERVSAVYGATLSKEEERERFAAFRSMCAMGRKMSSGEIGCALSHLAIYERVQNPVCILEDDIEISGDMNAALNACEEFLKVDVPRVVLLSGHCFETNSKERFVRVGGAMCTDAYCINKAAAQLILKVNRPVVSVADSWNRWARRYGLEIYHYNPTIVRQLNDDFGTDVSKDLKALHGIDWFAYKLGRVFTKLTDVILFRLTGI